MAPSKGCAGALRSVTTGGAVCRRVAMPPPSFVTRPSVLRRLLVLVLGPEARILVQECERFERLHPVEEQDAIQVVVLVLEHARLEVLELHVERLAVAAKAPDTNAAIPGHLPA